MLDIRSSLQKKVLFKLRDGQVMTDVQKMRWGDAVTIKRVVLTDKDGRHTDLEPGVILRPNRRLRETSPKGTTHVVYHDVYEAFRGATHAVSRYGIRDPELGTEANELVTDVKALREYVRLIFKLGPHLQHVKADLDIVMQKLLDDYDAKTDDHKKIAKKHMRRGFKTKDSLGRDNPGAAGRALGEAVEHLLERTENVQWLAMHMDQRSVQSLRLINMHIEVFQELWDAYCPAQASAIDWNGDQPYVSLSEFRNVLEAMKVRPFNRNAAHTAKDISHMIVMARSRNSTDRNKAAIKLKNGVRWVFALHYLQMEVLFPLSDTIERLKHRKRGGERLKEKTGRRYMPIPTEAAPEIFGDLKERMGVFQGKLDKCSDEFLEHGVKEQTLGLLAMAFHNTESDWRKVKLDLDAITYLL